MDILVRSCNREITLFSTTLDEISYETITPLLPNDFGDIIRMDISGNTEDDMVEIYIDLTILYIVAYKGCVNIASNIKHIFILKSHIRSLYTVKKISSLEVKDSKVKKVLVPYISAFATKDSKFTFFDVSCIREGRFLNSSFSVYNTYVLLILSFTDITIKKGSTLHAEQLVIRIAQYNSRPIKTLSKSTVIPYMLNNLL